MSSNLPRITVVTPSFNQAQFLEQTILSVIGQDYSNLEYILMDGGSTDGSVEIIKKYEQHFSYWQSKKDNGQAAAINEGFRRSSGEILCWLNSDDLFMPGTLKHIAEHFASSTKPLIVMGNCLHFYENSSKARGSNIIWDCENLELLLSDYVIQPSTFWNKLAWEKNGILNESFHFVFDWEWFIRAKINDIDFRPIRRYLSLYRFHDAHKTGSGGGKRSEELSKIYSHFGSDKLGMAYKKWSKMNRNKFIHYLVYISNLRNWKLPLMVLWMCFFRNIKKREFFGISRM